MTKKKETTQKSLKKTSKGKKGKITQLEKLEKKAPNQVVEKKKDNGYKSKGGQGGSRAGAGRKKTENRERLNTLKDMAEDYALEVVNVDMGNKKGDKKKKTVKMMKLTRAEALLNVLFSEGVENKSIPAIKEFFDRTRGKSLQSIDHSGTIDTNDQYVPVGDALSKAHEVFKREQKKLLAKDIYDGSKE